MIFFRASYSVHSVFFSSLIFIELSPGIQQGSWSGDNGWKMRFVQLSANFGHSSVSWKNFSWSVSDYKDYLDQSWFEKDLEQNWFEKDLDQYWFEEDLDQNWFEKDLDQIWFENDLDQSSVSWNLFTSDWTASTYCGGCSGRFTWTS